MNVKQHSPGPWWQRTDGEKVYANVTSNSGVVADCGSRCDLRAQANARLIAAAPDLLEALRNLLDYANAYSDAMAEEGRGDCGLGENAPSVSVAGMARAAIAKATGQ